MGSEASAFDARRVAERLKAWALEKKAMVGVAISDADAAGSKAALDAAQPYWDAIMLANYVIARLAEPAEWRPTAWDKYVLEAAATVEKGPWPAGMNTDLFNAAQHLAKFVREIEIGNYPGGYKDAEPAEAGKGEVQRLRHVLERDRTAVADGLSAIKSAIGGRAWLRESRGSYRYDDERWKSEFGAALDEIEAALEPLRKVAGDWSDCPTAPVEIAHARRTPPTPAPAPEMVEVVARAIINADQAGQSSPRELATSVLAALAGHLLAPGMVAVPVEDLRLALGPLRVRTSREAVEATKRLWAATPSQPEGDRHD
jgi:hypothetical protein